MFIEDFSFYSLIFGCAGSSFLCWLLCGCVEGGYSLVAVFKALTVVASLVAEPGLWGAWASAVAAHGLLRAWAQSLWPCGLGCSVACGLFLDQGSNLCLLHWQVVSLPLSHQGIPEGALFMRLLGFVVNRVSYFVSHHCPEIVKVICDICEVAQSCPTLCDPMDCSLPGSSVHGIFQARVLEWVPFPFPGDLPDPGIEPGSATL